MKDRRNFFFVDDGVPPTPRPLISTFTYVVGGYGAVYRWMQARTQRGHLILETWDHAERRVRHWLVDTGSPISFSKLPFVEFGTRGLDWRPDAYPEESERNRIDRHHFTFDRIPVPNADSPRDAEYLSEHIGTEIDGLIGMDILGQYDWVYDASACALFFSKPGTSDADVMDLMDPAARRIPVTGAFGGLPVIEVEIDGATRTVLFDTGAQIGYFFDPEDMVGHETTDRFVDFSPLYNRPLPTETRNVLCNIGGVQRKLRTGLVTEGALMFLPEHGIEGIVGLEVTRWGRWAFSPQRGYMCFDNMVVRDTIPFLLRVERGEGWWKPDPCGEYDLPWLEEPAEPVEHVYG